MYSQQREQNFYPKRPLHSFQDLEVYQKTLECSVLVARKVDEWLTALDIERPLGAKSRMPKLQSRQGTNAKRPVSTFGTGTASDFIIKNLLACTLAIPHQVAEAHSMRFGDHIAGIAAIEKAMLNCNKMVVYLEQFRDICESGIEWEFFDDVIKKYLYVRRKMLHLEQAWKKFMPGEGRDEHAKR